MANKELEVSLLSIDTKDKKHFIDKLNALKKSNITRVHYDVMDNNFVNNVAFGPEHLLFLNERNFIVDVHLMVFNVDKYLDLFMKYPFDSIAFHAETQLENISLDLIKRIKFSKKKCGIAFKPDSDIFAYEKLINECDYIIAMGVNPGFGGQKFLKDAAINNLKKIKQVLTKLKKHTQIYLDGGVDFDTINLTKNYVDVFISGSFLTKLSDPIKLVEYVKMLK